MAEMRYTNDPIRKTILCERADDQKNRLAIAERSAVIRGRSNI
jgi:hypothetical protein